MDHGHKEWIWTSPGLKLCHYLGTLSDTHDAMYWISLPPSGKFVDKVQLSILEKTPGRILREDMKFKGIASRGARATGPRQMPFHGSTAAATRSLGPTC